MCVCIYIYIYIYIYIFQGHPVNKMNYTYGVGNKKQCKSFTFFKKNYHCSVFMSQKIIHLIFFTDRFTRNLFFFY